MDVIQLKYPHQLVNNGGPYSLAVGFFDGVHLGHQQVINRAIEHAKEKGVKSAVMTFDPHPSIVLGGRNEKVFYIIESLRIFAGIAETTCKISFFVILYILGHHD